MSEDNNQDVQDTPEVSPIEEKALARGWRPQEEWEGDVEEWVDARTFVQKGELMDTIHSERKRAKRLEEELSGVKTSVTAIKEHYEKLAKAEVEKALKDLKAQRREALRIDDHETADEIEERIDEIKQEKAKIESSVKEAPAEKSTPTVDPAVRGWLEQNPWMDENSSQFSQELAEETVAMLQVELSRGATPGVVLLDKVKEKMKKLYPDQLGKRQRTPASVDSSDASTRATKKGGSLVRKLSEEQRRIGERFVKAGAHTSLDEYAQALQKMGEI